MDKIETLEQLDGFAQEISGKQEEISTTLDALSTDKEATREILDAAVTEIKQYGEKLKTLQTLVKTPYAIERENSQEAKDYKIGKMTMLMFRNEMKRGQPGDAAEMLKMGAIPANNVQSDGGPIEVVPKYQKQYQDQHRAYGTKAAVSDDPLTSDGSDDSSFYGDISCTDRHRSRVLADRCRRFGNDGPGNNPTGKRYHNLLAHHHGCICIHGGGPTRRQPRPRKR